jgi:hypothetical protein
MIDEVEQVFGISFSIIGLLPSIASTLVLAIPYGGASAMIWGVRLSDRRIAAP